MTQRTKRDQFDEIDIDGDGVITVDELKMHLQSDPKITAAEASRIVDFADANSDGALSFEEFEAFTP
ncbi:EF-hand domain-containing protein [Nocardia sp. CA-084685]|uniref:EF-hand domain-containing protein n=1 Tax=Nocardia sp. CA-084685 TaxID=3239970 RepID=UPI003D975E7F